LEYETKFAKQLNRLRRRRKPSTRDEKALEFAVKSPAGDAQRERRRVAAEQPLRRLRAIGSQAAENFSHRIMPECWLKPNRRALATALIVPSFVSAVGLVLLVVGMRSEQRLWLAIAGGTMFAIGVACVAAIWCASRIPRLAYADGELLVYLLSLKPLRVPIDAVECFFLGQGPAHPAPPDHPVAKAANVIVRIADSASDFHERDVRPDLGIWRDGYITIRGLWCEPLSHERVNLLNRQLAEAHRAVRARQEVL
jgi:hypothetical protein